MKQILLFSFIIAISACTKKDDRFADLERALLSADIGTGFLETPGLLVIPNAGCEGCITSAEAFVKDNVGQINSLRVIFTGINSHKVLKQKIGRDIYSHSQVFIDRSNLFYSPDIVSIYPSIIYLDEKSVMKIESVSPDNPTAMQDFLSLLNEPLAPH